ncbi:unnamed protein product [Orchesella dallaii]|uniref:F-box domain-containing protein n=1 Tax=Orchesella dallaii TaxID=48710 RepID=A0ABP1QD50_9HEXA
MTLKVHQDKPMDTPFFMLDLPLLVIEKVLSFIVDPHDLKALRRTCIDIRDLIDKNADLVIHLKVIPKDLKGLENIVYNPRNIRWNNFRFPPELYYIGCRRHYVDTFNGLFSSFADNFSSHIQILEMDRLDFSNIYHVNLLKKCQKIVSLKTDAMMLKGMKEQRLNEILEDPTFVSVLEKLNHLDVTAFEFLNHSYQFEFMGKLLAKCKNLKTLGSWGYFPEWEQPIGGSTHLKYFLWPLLTFLRIRFPTVSQMLEGVETPEDLFNLNLNFVNDSMDWQSGKWIIDLSTESASDFTNLEHFLYSRIKSYSHRAVGWFDEAEFRKSGLSLMKNLSTIHIHNARDIKLAEPSPFDKSLFPKLQNLTLIVGNRLPLEEVENNLPLEKVVVDMLLNTSRPSVQTLALDIDLDHHHRYGSIDLPTVIRNFPNLHSLCIEEWGPSDKQILGIYEALPKLEILMFCGRNLSDYGILGSLDVNEQRSSCMGICKLKHLRILKIFSIRLPPKNVFPWPSKENNSLTDQSFWHGFSQMRLRKFHFLIKSEKITHSGLNSLMVGSFFNANLEFAMNWLPEGVNSVEKFNKLHETFRYLDPQSEPANFVIPDIGKWVL